MDEKSEAQLKITVAKYHHLYHCLRKANILKQLTKHNETRMHSSRMHTGRALTVSRGGGVVSVWKGGVSAWKGGCLPGGGRCLPGGGGVCRGVSAWRGGVSAQDPPENLEEIPPPPREQNHTRL